jgi:P27 family predicted phage terminase small subunit
MLSEAERRAYRKLGRLLIDMGVMTAADGTALALLAVALTQYWDARTQVARLGAVVKTAAGNLIQNPYLPVANKAWEQVVKLLSEFGLTPASRSRVQMLDGPGELSLADMLFAGVGEDEEF